MDPVALQPLDRVSQSREQLDRRRMRPVGLDEVRRGHARGKSGHHRDQPVERIAADPGLEGAPKPGRDRSRLCWGSSISAAYVVEAAPNIVPLPVQRVIDVKDEALDHQSGALTNRSTLDRVI